MMIQRRSCVTLVLLVVVLAGCGPVISSEWRKAARKDLTFDKALRDPAAYTGSIVIWGGIIIGVSNRPDGTSIAVLETPLGYRERPENSEYSGGRFIARTSQFLDPMIYAKGRKITVAGEIIGKETKPVGKSKTLYAYPVVAIKQIVLWSVPEYAPPAYWWYGGGDDLWYDEDLGLGLGEEEEEGEERGTEEHGERGRR